MLAFTWNGQQINAPTTGRVVSVASVFTGYWGAHYTGHTGSAHEKQRPVKRSGLPARGLARFMEASVALSPVALAALKILIVDRNRDHEVHGAVRLRGCLTPSWRYMQNPRCMDAMREMNSASTHVARSRHD